jgi:hypothetical protein
MSFDMAGPDSAWALCGDRCPFPADESGELGYDVERAEAVTLSVIGGTESVG